MKKRELIYRSMKEVKEERSKGRTKNEEKKGKGREGKRTAYFGRPKLLDLWNQRPKLPQIIRGRKAEPGRLR